MKLLDKDAIWFVQRLLQEFPAIGKWDHDISGCDLVDFVTCQIHELSKNAPLEPKNET